MTLLLLICGCSDRAVSDTGGGQGESTSDGTTQASTSSDGGTEATSDDGLDELETSGDTEAQPEPCPVDPRIMSPVGILIDGTEFFWLEPQAWTKACTVFALGDLNHVELDCPEMRGGVIHELEFFVDVEGAPDSLPFEIGQSVEFELQVHDESGGYAISWAIRDDAQRPLVMGHASGRMYDDNPNPSQLPDPTFFAPLTIELVDELCPTICMDPPPLGVPPECNCRRQLGLAFSLSPEYEPVVVLDRSAAVVPGEPPGHVSVLNADAQDDCEYDGPRRWSEFLFIALPSP